MVRNSSRPPDHGQLLKRMKEKRAVLDGIAAELRRIIGKPRNRTASRRLIFQPDPIPGSGCFF
jgi:hypothetical protein